MPWRTLSATQVLNEGGFAPTEVSALTAANAQDKLAATLDTTIQMVRGIMASIGITLGLPNEIPDSLRPHVSSFARWEMLRAMPQLSQLQTESRRAGAEEAEKTFKEVWRRELAIEPAFDDEISDFDQSGNWGSEMRITMRLSQIPASTIHMSTATTHVDRGFIINSDVDPTDANPPGGSVSNSGIWINNTTGQFFTWNTTTHTWFGDAPPQ